MVRIVAAGHLNWDVTLRVESLPAPDGEARITSQHVSGGGSAANVASALAGFDVAAGLIGSVGDDDHGHLARRELEDAGVDLAGVRVVDAGDTTVKYLVVDADGEVMVLANDGVNEAIGPEDVDESYVTGADHLHLTSQRPETAERLVDVAAKNDISVSFDPGRRLADRGYQPLLDRVDTLFLNDREAVSAFAEVRADPAEVVTGTDRVVVVKHGAAGATVYTPNGTFEHPGFGVEPVDTTGAGDAFAAGFLAVIEGDVAFDTDPVQAADAELDTAVAENESTMVEDEDDAERYPTPTGNDPDPNADESDPVPAGDDYERALEVANACGALAACEEGARTAPSKAELVDFLSGQYRRVE